jgi:DNA polymerase II large subunit
LEIIGIEHEIVMDNIVIPQGRALLFNLGINRDENIKEKILEILVKIDNEIKDKENVQELVNLFSKVKIKDKAGTFIGCRMGRPEKAKLRKLTGSPNVLFPVGEQRGRMRSFQEAVNQGYVKSEFPLFYCETCKKETVYPTCETCNSILKKTYYCVECGRSLSEKCEHEKCHTYSNRKVDIKYYMQKALDRLGMSKNELPELIKGIRGTSNSEHDMEDLAKGILRAKYNITVNKDGTIRYDATELPITHFKPKEIGTGIIKLKELGYTKDLYGKELETDDQILELKPHDILLPSCPETKDERADDVFFNAANFIDELLERFYHLPRFYKLKDKKDLVGQLVVCMAPHNCAGVIGRIIGSAKPQGLLASPYMHAAMRRDCFDYNTYLPIKEGDNWKIVKIGEYVEKLNPQKVVDNWGTKEINVEGVKTLGLDKSIKEVNVNNFTKHSPIKFFEVKTSLGKEINVTENHKFLVNNKTIRASELKVGDKLPLTYNINIKPKNIEEFNLIGLLKEENLMVSNIKNIVLGLDKTHLLNIWGGLNISKRQFSNYNLRDSYPLEFVLKLEEGTRKEIYKIGRISFKRDRVKLPIKIKLTNNLLEVIGLYIAEGYSRSISGKKGLNQVYIASCEGEIREFIKKAIFDSFGLKPSERKEDRVTFSSKILYLLFNQVLEAGSVAKEKRIPSLFLSLPLEKLACILRGYFEGDGSAEKNRKKVSCDSISEGLLYDLEFCLARFGIFVKRYKYKKEPGQVVKDFYIKKNRAIPKFGITKLIIGSNFVDKFKEIGFLSNRKNKILEDYKRIKEYGMEIEYDSDFVYDPIISINELAGKESYCLNVDTKNHLVVANSMLNFQCDGDEAAIMLLLDVLINFSRKFLPAHRGGTQDAPLVLNSRIRAGEVDDQILDLEMVSSYPLELYEFAEQGKHSSEIKIDNVKRRLKEGRDNFTNTGFTHDTSNFNDCVVNSSYKVLPSMKEKVGREMELCSKLRSVNVADVARLIIERHFIRDIRGNLRKFSMQEFRCVGCNEKFRRPPMIGVCTKCGGKIIFTISEGSIIKYLEPALDLANNFAVPPYTKQGLELAKIYIQSIFGKDETKQVELKKWF